MTIKIVFLCAILITAHMQLFGQQSGLSFQEAEKLGIRITRLDSTYKSAVHADTSLSVFKTESEQKAMYEAYVKLLKDLGKFLSDNNYEWEKPTRCFNRIYFNANGTIDYFLFNFLGTPEDKPSEDKEKEFAQLLNKFIKDYKISLTANSNFSQCSPATYMPKE